MVATGADRRSCTTWQFDTDAVCIPLVSSTGHGKKSLNYVHYQSGKFALGTILAAVIPKNPSVLRTRFLHLYLSHFRDTVLVPLMKGAANVSLSMKEIASVEIPVPPLDEQQNLINLIFRIEDEYRELLRENNHQADLLKQLRKAVLQDAVEGKLTAEWRNQNQMMKGDPQYDAAALLVQIKAEKERLVKAGKIKKEKPFPPITESNKSFDLPYGWVRCRLGETVESMTNGIYKPAQFYSDIGTPSIRMYNIQDGYLDFSKISRMILTHDELANYALKPGDLLVNRVNSRELVGKAALVRDLREVTVYEAMNIRIRFIEKGNLPRFANLYFRTNYVRGIFQNIAKQASGQVSINQPQVASILFPLPPLSEQQAIVARVDNLMATIDELEKQVSGRKEQAQMLMQAVLREAFNGGAANGN